LLLHWLFIENLLRYNNHKSTKIKI
jgi:hypothetical protein